MNKKMGKNELKKSEESLSMFLGLVIVAIMVGLVVNYFQRKKGNIDVPGISDQKIDVIDSGNSDQQKGNTRLKNYTVVRGDNLWKIAEKIYGSGYNWTDIKKANNLQNPSRIYPGDKLDIPDIGMISVMKSSNFSQRIDGSEYKVVRGDNLWKIALRAYGDGFQWVKIWHNNKAKLIKPEKLEIGMSLIIPRE